jgi:hypothetical protein
MQVHHRGAYEDDGIFNEAKIGLRLQKEKYTKVIFTLAIEYSSVTSKATKVSTSLTCFGLSYPF